MSELMTYRYSDRYVEHCARVRLTYVIKMTFWNLPRSPTCTRCVTHSHANDNNSQHTPSSHNFTRRPYVPALPRLSADVVQTQQSVGCVRLCIWKIIVIRPLTKVFGLMFRLKFKGHRSKLKVARGKYC